VRGFRNACALVWTAHCFPPFCHLVSERACTGCIHKITMTLSCRRLLGWHRDCLCCYSCVHTYLHLYIFTYIHTNIHTYMHAYIHACRCINTYIHTYMHMFIHNTYMYTHVRTYVHTYEPRHNYHHTYMRVLTWSYKHVYVCIQTYTYVCTYIRVFIYVNPVIHATVTHTYVCLYVSDQIELTSKLIDYFLWSNKGNINQIVRNMYPQYHRDIILCTHMHTLQTTVFGQIVIGDWNRHSHC